MKKKSISNIICKALPEVTAFLIYFYFFFKSCSQTFSDYNEVSAVVCLCNDQKITSLDPDF